VAQTDRQARKSFRDSNPFSITGLAAPTIMEHPQQGSTGWVTRSCGSADRPALKTVYSLLAAELQGMVAGILELLLSTG
jgi:hypothetical protein